MGIFPENLATFDKKTKKMFVQKSGKYLCEPVRLGFSIQNQVGSRGATPYKNGV